MERDFVFGASCQQVYNLVDESNVRKVVSAPNMERHQLAHLGTDYRLTAKLLAEC